MTLANHSEGDMVDIIVELTQDSRLVPSPIGVHVSIDALYVDEDGSRGTVHLELDPTMYMRRVQGNVINEDTATVKICGYLSERIDDKTYVVVVKRMTHLAGEAARFASIEQMLKEHDVLDKLDTAFPPPPPPDDAFIA